MLNSKNTHESFLHLKRRRLYSAAGLSPSILLHLPGCFSDSVQRTPQILLHPASVPPCLAQRHSSYKATYVLRRVELEPWSIPTARAELSNIPVRYASSPSIRLHHEVRFLEVTARIVKADLNNMNNYLDFELTESFLLKMF